MVLAVVAVATRSWSEKSIQTAETKAQIKAILDAVRVGLRFDFMSNPSGSLRTKLT